MILRWSFIRSSIHTLDTHPSLDSRNNTRETLCADIWGNMYSTRFRRKWQERNPQRSRLHVIIITTRFNQHTYWNAIARRLIRHSRKSRLSWIGAETRSRRPSWRTSITKDMERDHCLCYSIGASFDIPRSFSMFPDVPQCSFRRSSMLLDTPFVALETQTLRNKRNMSDDK